MQPRQQIKTVILMDALSASVAEKHAPAKQCTVDHFEQTRRLHSPDAKFVPKNFQKSALGLYRGNRFLMVSLKAKLKATTKPSSKNNHAANSVQMLACIFYGFRTIFIESLSSEGQRVP